MSKKTEPTPVIGLVLFSVKLVLKWPSGYCKTQSFTKKITTSYRYL